MSPPRKCHSCGAALDPRAPWTCAYCNAPQYADEDDDDGLPRIALSDEGIVHYLRRAIAGADASFVHPTIPEKKLASIRKIHGATVMLSETILAVCDCTVFGSASESFFITAKRLGWKNQMEAPSFLEWSHIDEDEVWVERADIVVGAARLGTLYGADDPVLERWRDVIATLARSARPPRASASGGRASFAGGRGPASPHPTSRDGAGPAPDPWLAIAPAFPRQLAPPRARDDVERLPRRPYPEDAHRCRLVDVHPSGEVVLAAGDGMVEIRYAANGARCRAFEDEEEVLGASFSPDGALLALACANACTTLQDARTGRIVGRTPEMTAECEHVVWLGRAPALAVATVAGDVAIVDTSARPTLRILDATAGDADAVGGLAASPDGTLLYVSAGDRLGAFDTGTGRVVWRVDVSAGELRLAASPRGDLLAAVGYDSIALFDARTGQPGPAFPIPGPRSVGWPEGGVFGGGDLLEMSWTPKPRFSPTGEAIALQDRTGNLVFVDVAARTVHPIPRENGRAFIEDLAWFADGNHLLLGMADNSLAIWRARPLAGIARFPALGG